MGRRASHPPERLAPLAGAVIRIAHGTFPEPVPITRRFPVHEPLTRSDERWFQALHGRWWRFTTFHGWTSPLIA